MKPSYFQTPRTLDEATFYSWADPLIKPDEPKSHPADKVIYVLAIISIVLIFVVLK